MLKEVKNYPSYFLYKYLINKILFNYESAAVETPVRSLIENLYYFNLLKVNKETKLLELEKNDEESNEDEVFKKLEFLIQFDKSRLRILFYMI
jgi:hypothetical protein